MAVERALAFAKVNLRLRVFPPDRTGYHPVETLLLRLDLADAVAVETGGEGVRLTLDWEGPAEPLPPGPENLAWRAAEAFCGRADVSGGVRIHLLKRIPPGAGLGGGSADAAAVLRALNEAHGGPLSREALLELAGALGSDVPFSLLESPFALGWERGRRLLPLPAPPSRAGLVALPPFRVSTAVAYGWVDEDRDARTADADAGGLAAATGVSAAALPAPERLADWRTLARLAENDFEASVIRRHPVLETGLAALRRARASPTVLCGSGSALFAAFETEEARDRAVERLGEAVGGDWRLLCVRAPPGTHGRKKV